VSLALGIALKPLALILLFGIARLLAIGLHRVMKPGRLKDWLFQDKGPL
jgi:hypothetical protein